MFTFRSTAAFATAALLHVAPALTAAAFAAEQNAFTVIIENVSTDETLKLAGGETRRVPVAPGAYAIVSGDAAIFEEGKPAGQDGLEALAEDGNTEPLIAYLKAHKAVRVAGMFVPGQPFTVSAAPGDRLLFAAMFVESNDLFYSPGPEGLALFDASGQPIGSDQTGSVRLWDAGTEVNEAPGAGPNQAPRQAAPGTGPAENGVVHLVDDGFAYPPVSGVLRVTVSSK